MVSFEEEMSAIIRSSKKKIKKANPKAKPRKLTKKEIANAKWARAERKSLDPLTKITKRKKVKRRTK